MRFKNMMHAACGVILLFASFSPATVAEANEKPSVTPAKFVNDEGDCLTDIVFREARSEIVGVWRMIAMVVIARRDDTSRRWPNTVCGNRDKPGAFSGINMPLDLTLSDFLIWSQVQRVTGEVYDGAWRDQFLPRGWECVRYFKLSPKRLSTLKPADKKRLGITKGKGLDFFEKLNRVATLGAFSFYEEPNCAPLPTT